MLGVLYAEQGRRDLATQQFRAAVQEAERLLPKEPNNTVWLDYASDARANLAEQLLLAGESAEAASQTKAVCDGAAKLLSHDPRNPAWRSTFSACWRLQAKLALARDANPEALNFARRSLAAAQSVHSGDAVADAYRIGDAYRLVGDIQLNSGDGSGARESWTAALRQLPGQAVERPSEMAERAAILRRLGRSVNAQPISSRLQAMGYREMS
jgi:tetratricopeptide (TPR) repeat protein